MKSPVRVTLRCGHCGEPYRDRATNLKPGSTTTCEQCDTTVFLDPTDPWHAAILHRAQTAREDRRARLRDLRAGWVTPHHSPAASILPLAQPTDILAKLDTLLARLSAIEANSQRS